MVTAAPTTTNVSTDDRLGFALCLALAIHAIIVLGINFAQEELTKTSPTLEITLAQHHSEKAPENADFAAQFNQEGSGTESEKKEITTERLSPFHDTKIREVNPEQQIKAKSIQPQTDKNMITTTSASNQSTPLIKEKPKHEKEKLDGKSKNQLERSREIASMEARLDRQRQKDARRPRIHRLTSVSTRSSVDAAYLYKWRNKIEVVGNIYYPEEARTQQIFGSLQLMVSILPDGKIYDIQIVNSSGYQILDKAAIDTVKRAAPFDPFPQELRNEVDRLEIIRTWRFDRDNQLTAE